MIKKAACLYDNSHPENIWSPLKKFVFHQKYSLCGKKHVLFEFEGTNESPLFLLTSTGLSLHVCYYNQNICSLRPAPFYSSTAYLLTRKAVLYP